MSFPTEVIPLIKKLGGSGTIDEAVTRANQYTDDTVADALDEAKAYTDEASINSYIVAEGTAGTVTLGNGWSTSTPHSVNVTVSGYTLTANTMVTMLPNHGVMAQMKEDGVQTIYIVNDNGTLTAYAIGNAPTVALTAPVLFTEVG